jgi:CheY-like chemotaxis protein
MNALRVLIVDDYPDMAPSLAAVLKILGFNAREATSGPAALQLAEEAWPDVVLLDLRLPGMDGFEVAKQLRGQSDRPAPVFIAVTGCGDQKSIDRCRSEGFDYHFLKPADPLDLKARLELIAFNFRRTISAF